MSGTEAPSLDDPYGSLEAMLGRHEPLNSLSALASALEPVKSDDVLLSDCAICFDTNVLLKLAGHRRQADIIDYFIAKHSGPLIISAQSIQEFWNNQLSGLSTISKNLEDAFKKLQAEIEKAGEDLGDYGVRVSDLINELKGSYGYLHDRDLRRKVSGLVELLSKKAKFIEVPRQRFHKYASQRQQTKTPPGFEDKRDGDFYIWIDFLYGMKLFKDDGAEFRKAIMVTEDKKADWSRGGVAHPVLSSEVYSFVGLPFSTFGIEELVKAIDASAS